MRSSRDFYKFVGSQIRARRTARNVTQQELADALHPKVTRATIANIEAGKQGILAWSLFQIAERLGVDISRLFPATAVLPDHKRLENELIEARVPLEASRKLAALFSSNKK